MLDEHVSSYSLAKGLEDWFTWEALLALVILLFVHI